MKKQTKSILKNILRVSPVVVGIVLSVGGCYKFSSGVAEQSEAQKSNRKIVQKVLRSEEFERFEDDYRQALYNAYKSGVISAQEYDSKLAGLRSEENVYAHREEYMDKGDQQTMNDNYDTIDRTAESIGLGGVIACGGGFVGSFAAYAIFHNENKKKNCSGSIMGRTNYLRFFIDNDHEDEEISEME